jgi:hypothetical protein
MADSSRFNPGRLFGDSGVTFFPFLIRRPLCGVRFAALIPFSLKPLILCKKIIPIPFSRSM